MDATGKSLLYDDTLVQPRILDNGNVVDTVQAAVDILKARAASGVVDTVGQRHLYIDPVSGVDTNNGTDAATPVKTMAAINKLIALAYINGASVVINLIGDPLATPGVPVSIPCNSIWLPGGDGISSVSYRGPQMIRVVPVTGPATAALDAVTPTDRVDQAGAPDAAGNRTKLLFTGAAPGWTVNSWRTRKAFARIKRGADLVIFEIPIADNGADFLIVDVAIAAGTILATDTVEIVQPAVKFTPVSSFVIGISGFGAPLGNFDNLAAATGCHFERVEFNGSVYAGSTFGINYDRCFFGPPTGGNSAQFEGDAHNFRNCIFENVGFRCAGTITIIQRKDTATSPLNTALTTAWKAAAFSIGSVSKCGQYSASANISSYAGSGGNSGITVAGPGSNLEVGTGVAVQGDSNGSVGIRCVSGGQAKVNGGKFATIVGAAGALRLGAGGIIGWGTGAGQFEEAAGWNGNFCRVLENVGGFPTFDASRVYKGV